ncbi:MAG: hypothetical protein GY834_01835 [Bacteroidetes bacterium]|nr:hypothetical protein [Bacteroidota bacterium]
MKKDFHSFRYTVSEKLKQSAVEEKIASEIIGHASGSLTYNLYSTGYSPSVLKNKGIKIIKGG